MKNVTNLKASKIESPKTPGGISKSLLTPCRRVGLSRNWKKAGPSPFVSPITTGNSTTAEPKVEKKETRKRKVRTPTEELEEIAESPQTPVVVGLVAEDDAVAIFSSKTDKPYDTPRRKKSKTVLPGLCKSKSITTSNNAIIKEAKEPSVQNESLPPTPTSNESGGSLKSQENCKEACDIPDVKDPPMENTAFEVGTPISSKSASKLRKNKSNPKIIDSTSMHPEENSKTVAKNDDVKENKSLTQVTEKVQYEVKQKSPNDLTKECVVVIQKKMFKTDKIKKTDTNTKKQNKENSSKTVKNTLSQTVFDSDSDEVPLCQLNNKLKTKEPNVITIDDDDDFETKTTDLPVKKLDKNTSTGGLKPKPKSKPKFVKPKKLVESKLVEANLSFCDDDEDFDLDNKKTILIRKTYDKTSKLQKAKTTGSITQRDIDELRARIEHKKKMLMAKSMTEDTEELRTLIKKWQKGCQDALMELMELMKTKFPEKDNMDYAEMLRTLNIPVLLVGYDEDNDCFNTPSDENVLLTTFKDV